MIRKALKNDLLLIKNITEACTQHLIEQEIFQWNQDYPSLAVFKKDIEEEALYVYEKKNEILGCIMFSKEKDPLYNQIEWLTLDDQNLYVHRLAVHPESQKQGIARKLMDFVERFALQNDIESVRLDTFSQNPRNIRFYEARGYKNLGDVYFVNQSQYPFHCFEKVLKRI